MTTSILYMYTKSLSHTSQTSEEIGEREGEGEGEGERRGRKEKGKEGEREKEREREREGEKEVTGVQTAPNHIHYTYTLSLLTKSTTITLQWYHSSPHKQNTKYHFILCKNILMISPWFSQGVWTLLQGPGQNNNTKSTPVITGG